MADLRVTIRCLCDGAISRLIVLLFLFVVVLALVFKEVAFTLGVSGGADGVFVSSGAVAQRSGSG